MLAACFNSVFNKTRVMGLWNSWTEFTWTSSFHVWSFLSCVSDYIRVRHPAGHHGEGRTKQLASQRHLRGKLQRCQLPETAGGPGPATGEEVCHRRGSWETAEHDGTGDVSFWHQHLVVLCFSRPQFIGHLCPFYLWRISKCWSWINETSCMVCAQLFPAVYEHQAMFYFFLVSDPLQINWNVSQNKGF